jgi:hypothetical protein
MAATEVNRKHPAFVESQHPTSARATREPTPDSVTLQDNAVGTHLGSSLSRGINLVWLILETRINLGLDDSNISKGAGNLSLALEYVNLFWPQAEY